MNNDEFQKMVISELREIKAEQKKTCIEMAKHKSDLENHLNNIEKRNKSMREMTQTAITIISVSIAASAVVLTLLQ